MSTIAAEYRTRPGGRALLSRCISGGHFMAAVLSGFALRVFFIWYYPFEATDTRLYDELARNWLLHGVYGQWLGGRLIPVDVRVPGYPAFLALVYSIAGYSRLAVLLAQAILDLISCALIAGLAAMLAQGPRSQVPSPSADCEGKVRRAATVTLWLAALCPFTANYTAVALTETLAIFLTTVAFLFLVSAYQSAASASSPRPPAPSLVWFLAGLAVGVGTLVRPETPLILIAAGLVLLVRWRRPRDWRKLLRASLLMGAGLVLPLLPWGARNWHTLGEAQFLAARYAQLPSENPAPGFYDWTRTWLTRYSEVDVSVWKLNEEPINIDELPAAAFDSAEERARVAALLARYNEGLKVSPELDAEFERLAVERARRHPIRTWVWLPLRRAVTMWFMPRIELLGYSGNIFPLATEWDEDREDLLVSLGFALLNLAYLGLAVVGFWRFRHAAGVALLATFVLVRSAFFTQMDAPEPRYMLVCFPVILSLAALALAWFDVPPASSLRSPACFNGNRRVRE